MGVDHYSCDGCSCGYPDDSDYICSCDCGSGFCSFQCGKLENYFNPWNPYFQKKGPAIEDDDPRHDKWEEGDYSIDKNKPITCAVCRKEKENDWVLLCALLRYYKITREEAIEIWKKQED